MGWVHYFRPRTKLKLKQGLHVPWIENNKRADYIRSVVFSFVPWSDYKVIMAMNAKAREMSEASAARGEHIVYVIDHVIPLNHPEVCGLSVVENLRIVPSKVNGTKGNKWCSEWHPEQIPLFELAHAPVPCFAY